MTEKRFTISGVGISDHEKKRLYDLQTIDGFISVRDELNALHEENEQLKQQIKKLEAQLYKVEDGVCDICNNMYLVQQGRYFVSKCKKGHDECSKMDLDYCDDFELNDGDVE